MTTPPPHDICSDRFHTKIRLKSPLYQVTSEKVNPNESRKLIFYSFPSPSERKKLPVNIIKQVKC